MAYYSLYEASVVEEEYWNNSTSSDFEIIHSNAAFSIGLDGGGAGGGRGGGSSSSSDSEEAIQDPFAKYTPGDNVSQLKFVDSNTSPLPKSLQYLKDGGGNFSASEKKKLAAYFHEKFREENYKKYKELPKRVKRNMVNMGIAAVRDKMRLCLAKETLVVLKTRFSKVVDLLTKEEEEEEIYHGITSAAAATTTSTTAFLDQDNSYQYQESYNNSDIEYLRGGSYYHYYSSFDKFYDFFLLVEKYHNLRCQYNYEFERVADQYKKMHPEFYASLKKLM